MISGYLEHVFETDLAELCSSKNWVYNIDYYTRTVIIIKQYRVLAMHRLDYLENYNMLKNLPKAIKITIESLDERWFHACDEREKMAKLKAFCIYYALPSPILCNDIVSIKWYELEIKMDISLSLKDMIEYINKIIKK